VSAVVIIRQSQIYPKRLSFPKSFDGTACFVIVLCQVAPLDEGLTG
jgi:hypothetical protein